MFASVLGKMSLVVTTELLMRAATSAHLLGQNGRVPLAVSVMLLLLTQLAKKLLEN